MKILYMNHTSRIGGAEKSLLDLMNWQITNSDIELNLLLFEEGESRFSLDKLWPNCHVEKISPILLYAKRTSPLSIVFSLIPLYAVSALKIRKKVIAINPSIIHFNSFKSLMLGILVLNRYPCIFHSRDYYENLIPRLLLNLASTSCKAVIAVSKFIKKSNFISHNRLKSFVVYNGFYINTKPAKKWPNNLDELCIGIIGEISYSKGVDIIIDQFQSLQNDISCTLKIHIYGKVNFGNKNYINFLEEKISKQNLQEQILFIGYVSDISIIMNDIDVIVVPSRYPESFGRVIIEAMNHRKIVFSTKKGGAKELITHGKNGFFWSENVSQNAEILNRLMSGNIDACDILDNAMHFVQKNCDIDRVYKKIHRIYNLIHRS